jgi:tRNA(Ile)-lysidine synthase
MREFQVFLEQRADVVWRDYAELSKGRVEFDIPFFNSQPQPVKIELILRAIAELGSGRGDLTEGHFDRIVELTNRNKSNSNLELPNGIAVRREYEKIIFAERKIKNQLVNESAELNIPGKTRFGSFSIEANVATRDRTEFSRFKKDKNGFAEWFDYEKLVLPLTVRFRSAGDRFAPLGANSEKKVGKFLTDARVPRDVRDNILIVSDTEKIIWVWPIRISEEAKLTERTAASLRIKITTS